MFFESAVNAHNQGAKHMKAKKRCKTNQGTAELMRDRPEIIKEDGYTVIKMPSGSLMPGFAVVEKMRNEIVERGKDRFAKTAIAKIGQKLKVKNLVTFTNDFVLKPGDTIEIVDFQAASSTRSIINNPERIRFEYVVKAKGRTFALKKSALVALVGAE